MGDEYKDDDVVGTVQVRQKVSREQVDTMLAVALDSGIGYWCDKAVCDDFKGADYASSAVSRGSVLALHYCEDEGDKDTAKVVELTLEKFLAAIPPTLEWARKTWDAFVEDSDAEDADVLVQYAVFGEIIYG